MKRFFCKVCQKIKRVRNYPPRTITPQADNPEDRIGICTYHKTNLSVDSKKLRLETTLSK